MYFGRILLSTVVLIIIGVLGSLIYMKIDNKDFFGGTKIGMIVGIIGGVLGGFLFDLAFKLPILSQLEDIPYVQYLLVNKLDINFLATFLGVWLFLWFYEYVSKHTERS